MEGILKKKIVTILFVFCLIVPAMFILGACNSKEITLATEKDVKVYAEYNENELEHIVLKISLKDVTASLSGSGQFKIDWNTSSSSGGSTGPIFMVLQNKNEIVSYYAKLLYNYKYSFVVPENVTSISSLAFSYTSLTDIEMDSINELGTTPFAYCKELKSIKITNEYSQYDTRNNCNAIIKDNELVVGCKTTIIPSTVITIGKDAFLGSSITSLNVHSVISTIGESAFYNSSISKITLPNTITSIGKYAFYGCKELKTIELPNSLSVLNDSLFENSGLVDFNIKNAIVSIGKNVLKGCKNIQTLNIGSYNGDITPILLFGESAVYLNNMNITSLIVDAKNTRYSDNNNSNVIMEKSTNTLVIGCKNSVLHNDISIIGDYSFAFSSGLTTITLPDSITKIGVGAFYGTDLYEIKLNDNLTIISADAFMYTKLKNVNLARNNLTIGIRAFSGIRTFEYVIVNSRYSFEDLFFITAISELPIVYYYGTSTEFNNNENGRYFSESFVYFYSAMNPSDNSSYYWHYDLDGKTPSLW